MSHIARGQYANLKARHFFPVSFISFFFKGTGVTGWLILNFVSLVVYLGFGLRREGGGGVLPPA